MINVAVLGYGTVGSGVVEVIEKNKDMVNKKSAQELEVKYILDLRDFPGDPYENKVIHDFNTILQDDSVTIICETMGGVGAAYQFTKQALELGKSVCTSNKELVAKHGPELLQIAREHNCNYLFEASVGGGIPIIRPLNYSLTAEKIEAVNGILNGTTNYILSKMEKEGAIRIAKNSPIQGSAADIVKKAMIDVSKALKESKLPCKILLQVHDELIFECDENEKIIQQAISLIKEKMENAVKLKVPLRVSIEYGKNWGEFH